MSKLGNLDLSSLSPWMKAGSDTKDPNKAIKFYEDNPELLTKITAEALDNTGIHAAAVRDFRKALMLTDPKAYMEQRLSEIKKYENMLETDFKSAYTTILATTGDSNIARQVAEQRVSANVRYYMTIVDASYPDLADSYKTLAKANIGENPLLQ